MDAFTAVLWILRIGFVIGLYLFLVLVVRALWRDLRASVRAAAPSVGRLIVLASPLGTPAAGSSIPIDAVTSLGGDVNNTVVVEDPAVAGDHGLLSYRGLAWYLEERESGMRPMLVNGEPFEGATAVHFGDEITLGEVRLRLERPITTAEA
ncbi:MAG: hypothetical protein KF809_04465 [Chloroflexi bacterium]|nr:hypothetical protein [Chloroflexota bacterium]